MVVLGTSREQSIRTRTRTKSNTQRQFAFHLASSFLTLTTIFSLLFLFLSFPLDTLQQLTLETTRVSNYATLRRLPSSNLTAHSLQSSQHHLSQWPAARNYKTLSSTMMMTLGNDHLAVCDSFAELTLPLSPLCIEEFDLSDKNFKPCPCGYKVSTSNAKLQASETRNYPSLRHN